MYLQWPLSCFSRQKYLQSFKLLLTISVSSIVVGVLIFTTNHMKLDEITMVSNNFGKLQVPVSKISWACWLSASAAPTAAMTVLFLGLNIVFFWQHGANDFRWNIYISLQICLPHAAVLQWGYKQKEILIAELNFIAHLSCKLIYNFFWILDIRRLLVCLSVNCTLYTMLPLP